MLDSLNSSKKIAPTPTSAAKDLTKYFELELYEASITASNRKEYLGAAMLSWACVEECFLPQLIEFVSKNQNIKVEKKFLEVNVAQLIRYYYLISYDEELYQLLEEGRKLRNKVVHEIYNKGSIDKVQEQARLSSKYNILTLIEPMVARLNGNTPIPSLNLYATGWNDATDKFKKNIQEIKKRYQ